MTTVTQTDFARNWQDIAANLLKLGATAYHHGHHAGRAPGKAAVGLQRTVRRRPLARQYVAGRERCTAQHVFGLRPRGLVGWSAWRTVLCPPRVLHLACANDGLCSPGRHPHHARRALWSWASRLGDLLGCC